jgi:membrane protein DedA with SNARE-associated domain
VINVLNPRLLAGRRMTDTVSIIARYGYQSLAVLLFMEAIGLPIPGALALLAAGAAVASGAMRAAIALPVAVLAMMLADTLLYVAGRYSGWALLAMLCGLSLSPEGCIMRSAKLFYQRGRITLLIAKFIPGINSMAPPLAGSMNMRTGQFLRLDVAGVLIYVLTYGSLGFLFRDIFKVVVGGMQAFGRTAEWLIAGGLVVYIGYRVWLYAKNRLDRSVHRVPVSEVVARLNKNGGSQIVIADVRSHGYYDPDAQRVRGSIRLEPNNLDSALETVPKDAEIYLYCT